MIEFTKRDDGATVVSRKDDDFLGVIEQNDDKKVFASTGSVVIDKDELLVIAVSVLGLPEHGELVQDRLAQGYKIEIKLTDE